MSGQHLHRTAVAFAEIRRGVLAGLPTGAGGSGGYQPLLSVLQLRTTAPKPGVPNAGGSLPGPGCAAMTESIRKKSFVELGALPPNPRNLPLSGQNGCFGSTTIEALERRIGLRRNATRAPAQAPEWRGGGPAAGPAMPSSARPAHIGATSRRHTRDDGE